MTYEQIVQPVQIPVTVPAWLVFDAQDRGLINIDQTLSENMTRLLVRALKEVA